MTFSTRAGGVFLLTATVLLAGRAAPAFAQAMPDPKAMSGIPRPVDDLPQGTLSVRVIRGSFANNLAGVDVGFSVNGKTTTVKTDSEGRAQIAGLAKDARVVASVTVGGELIESQSIAMGPTGIRVMLVASEPNGSAGSAAPGAGAPAPRGAVVFGPESRIVIDFAEERLNVYYSVQVVNGAATPVDIGGPLILELPSEARRASILEGSTPSATANGPRVIVTGPFASGTTAVNIGFELPSGGPSARLEQTWPVALQGFALFALRTGELDVASPQVVSKRFMVQQGQPLVAAEGTPIAAGGAVVVDITGLPHHPRWPLYVALSLAGVCVSMGVWAAAFPARRPRAA